MQEKKRTGCNGLGLFLVGEKASLGKAGELFLPSDSSACGPAPLPGAPAKPRALTSKTSRGNTYFSGNSGRDPRDAKGQCGSQKGTASPWLVGNPT